MHGTVQCLGDNARRCGFTHPANPGQHKGMGKAATVDRIGKRAHHGFLPDKAIEIRWAVFTGKNPVILLFSAVAHGRVCPPWMVLIMTSRIEPSGKRLGRKMHQENAHSPHRSRTLSPACKQTGQWR